MNIYGKASIRQMSYYTEFCNPINTRDFFCEFLVWFAIKILGKKVAYQSACYLGPYSMEMQIDCLM